MCKFASSQFHFANTQIYESTNLEMPKRNCYLTLHLTFHLCRQKSRLNLHARQMVDQPFWDDPMLWPWKQPVTKPTAKVVETWMSLSSYLHVSLVLHTAWWNLLQLAHTTCWMCHSFVWIKMSVSVGHVSSFKPKNDGGRGTTPGRISTVDRGKLACRLIGGFPW